MQEIKTDIKRSITSVSFYIPVLAMVITIALGVGMKQLFPETMRQGLIRYYHVHILLQSLGADIVLMVVPILCTLPYTASFLDEYTSGYIKVYLIKCDKANYIKGKVLAPAISGGLSLVCGILIFYIITCLIYTPLELADEHAISPFIEVLKQCVIFFVCGALWASVGALLANISLSKYMAYASPFVIFYVLVMLAERYFQTIYVINPKEWILTQNTWVLKEWGASILMLLLTIIVCIINDWVIERKIEAL